MFDDLLDVTTCLSSINICLVLLQTHYLCYKHTFITLTMSRCDIYILDFYIISQSASLFVLLK